MKKFLIGFVIVASSVGLQSCEQSCYDMVEDRAEDVMDKRNITIGEARSIALTELGKEREKEIVEELTKEHGATYNGTHHPALVRKAQMIRYQEHIKLKACLAGHIMEEKGLDKLTDTQFDYFYFGIDTMLYEPEGEVAPDE